MFYVVYEHEEDAKKITIISDLQNLDQMQIHKIFYNNVL